MTTLRLVGGSDRITCMRTGRGRSGPRRRFSRRGKAPGCRVFDIAVPFCPEEIGYFVPPQPTTGTEPMRGRAKIRHTADLFVAEDGLMYVTDYDAGLYILQWNGS